MHVEEEERGRGGRVGEGDRKTERNEDKTLHEWERAQTPGEETGKAREKGRRENKKERKNLQRNPR